MSSSREKILNKLRAARQPFPDAPPRPKTYESVARLNDESPDGLLSQFVEEIRLLRGEAFITQSDDEACEKTRELLRFHQTTHLLSWDFRHIPIKGLENAIRDMGITITQPDIHDEFRAETLALVERAEVGLTGVDAAIAATGTLIFSTGPGKGRIPTVLPPVHIAIVSADQLLPRLEDWIAGQRARGLPTIASSANVCFITGPSRTGDIEKQLVLGMHGPGQVQVIVGK